MRNLKSVIFAGAALLLATPAFADLASDKAYRDRRQGRRHGGRAGRRLSRYRQQRRRRRYRGGE